MLFHKFTVSFSPLHLLREKEQGIITRLQETDESLLRQLIALGIKPGVKINLESKFPDFRIRVGDNLLKIDVHLAKLIQVKVFSKQG